MYAGTKHWNLRDALYEKGIWIYSCLIPQCEKTQGYTTGWFRSYEHMSKTGVWLTMGLESGGAI